MLDQSTSMPLDWVDTLSPADIQTPAFVYNADAVNARIAGLKERPWHGRYHFVQGVQSAGLADASRA